MKCMFVDLGRQYGGAEKYLEILIDGWTRIGNEAIIVARKDSRFAELMKCRDDIITVEAKFSTISLLRARKILQNFDSDVINVNGINSGVFASLLRMGLPRITTVHSDSEFDRSNKSRIIQRIFRNLEIFNLKKSEKIIAVSEPIKSLLISRGINARKITVISNGVQEITYDNYKTGVFKDSVRICFAGRLEKVKGCEYLVKAIAEIREERIECDIYGEGSERQYLESLIRNLKLADIIHVKDFRADFRNILPDYDILVVPSLYEASGLTVIEAMNAKVLTICSDVGGIPYIVHNMENGLLFDKGNADNLAETIKFALNNPEEVQRMIMNAFQDFKKYYRAETMVDRTIKEISSLPSLCTYGRCL